MRILTFDNDNNNSYTINFQSKIDFTYHINTSDFPLVHSHEDYWEFTLVTGGKIINKSNHGDLECGPNTLFISNPDDVHCLIKASPEDGDKLRYINIIVRQNRLFKLLEAFSPTFISFLKQDKEAHSFPDSFEMEIENVLHRIKLIEKDNYDLYNDMVCSALFVILHFLLDYSHKSNKGSGWIAELYGKMRSPDFIKLNVEGLCEAMDYSRPQMNRLMKKYLNTTPHDFLIDCKLRYAESLLQTSDMSLQEIVEAVGYSSSSAFIRNFKDKYYYTPMKYKKKGLK